MKYFLIVCNVPSEIKLLEKCLAGQLRRDGYTVGTYKDIIHMRVNQTDIHIRFELFNDVYDELDGYRGQVVMSQEVWDYLDEKNKNINKEKKK